MCCEIKNWSKSGKTHTHTEIKKARNNLFFKEAVKVGEISIDIGTEVRETNTPSEAPVMSVFISCNRCV